MCFEHKNNAHISFDCVESFHLFTVQNKKELCIVNQGGEDTSMFRRSFYIDRLLFLSSFEA